MAVAGQPPGAEVLPHRKTYDEYVRIVEPGRHVFRTRVDPLGRGLFGTLTMGGAVAMVKLGFFAKKTADGVLDVGLGCLMWLGALAVFLATAWGLRRGTVVEITTREITIKQRRFLRWRTSDWPISDFREAILEGRPEFNYGGRSVQLIPRLVFLDNPALAYFDKAWWMSEPFHSQEEADDFVRDLNASVERARRAPETF
jgi:hypothetical protein